ncbi:MAG TPA: Gfo/Idh/MocA family oxidoreductase [bacterium]|nr:Gfo/Idh/MocA family oxidoreductase [bacterium]
MGISIGLVGLGSFGSAFAPLFKSHPRVDRIGLCDREPERVKKFADDPFFKDKFNVRDAYASLDEICRSDLDALVIITQPWLHAPQCLQAMESGKHVYSAVPISSVPDGDEILGYCDRLIETCRRTGMRYMLGETTYYRSQTMFCRRQAAAGAFGDFVYAEGEYCHDIDAGCNLRQVAAMRAASAAGQEWKQVSRKYQSAGIETGPMHYPTHSTSGPVSVMKAHAVKVTAYGYRNRDGKGCAQADEITNEVALFRMSNGAAVRIAELREAPGILGQDSETFRIMGTRGSFSENRWFEIERPDPARLDLNNLPKPRVTKLTAAEMFDPLPPEVQEAFKRAMYRNEPIDEKDLQTRDFVPAGHGGSHPYLVHEFVEAVTAGRQPAINIWEAARYMVMGVMAHKSALKEGVTLDVPDWGDAPA